MAGVEEERHGGEKEGKRRGAARGAGAWQGLLHGAWGMGLLTRSSSRL